MFSADKNIAQECVVWYNSFAGSETNLIAAPQNQTKEKRLFSEKNKL